ncbi:MAG: 6-phosphofructokinase [Pyrinomonadaceae bacterium]
MEFSRAAATAPGLNAAIRAVVRRALAEGVEVKGIKNGWQGLIDDNVVELSRASTTGILPRGGTILGTSRTNPLKKPEWEEALLANWHKHGFTSLVAIGGEGTLSAALELHRRYKLPLVGIPKTIDNDLNGTDYTFGFDTAVGVVMEAIDRLHSTAESHHRSDGGRSHGQARRLDCRLWRRSPEAPMWCLFPNILSACRASASF